MTSDARPASWELPPHLAAADASTRPWEYVALRVTGVLLSVLVLGHFAVTHVVTDVARDDAGFVARRLSSALWVTWDATMLAAAIAHGGIGVRLVAQDHSTSAERARIATRSVTLAGVALFLLGLVAIVRMAHV